MRIFLYNYNIIKHQEIIRDNRKVLFKFCCLLWFFLGVRENLIFLVLFYIWYVFITPSSVLIRAPSQSLLRRHCGGILPR